MSGLHLLETPTTRTRMLITPEDIAGILQEQGLLAEAASGVDVHRFSERFYNSEKRKENTFAQF